MPENAPRYRQPANRRLDPVEVLHSDAHTGAHCFFPDPTCCPFYDEALDILDALNKGGYEVVRRG